MSQFDVTSGTDATHTDSVDIFCSNVVLTKVVFTSGLKIPEVAISAEGEFVFFFLFLLTASLFKLCKVHVL